MSYDKERDLVTGRVNIDDVSDYDAMGYDAAPRAGRYRYKMTRRPFSIGTQPKVGLLDYEESPTPKVNSGYYGVLTYNRELTEEEIRRFELTPE